MSPCPAPRFAGARSGIAMAESQLSAGSSAQQPSPRIWAIGGGKGGVGKSFMAANLAIALGRHGKRVVLVDLDLGGANIHTCIGMPERGKGVGDYLSQQADINDFVRATTFDGVGIISGASGNLQIANLKFFQKAKLLRNLGNIDADYVILDLGAGTTFNTLDFFNHAERGLLLVTPDPASVENAYRFLKSMFVRRLKSLPGNLRASLIQLLEARRDPDGKPIQTIAELLETMFSHYPGHAPELAGIFASTRLHLIVNQVTEPGDTELGHAMQIACSRYFGTDLSYLGCLQYDNRILRSLKQRSPFIAAYPQSMVAIHLERMAALLLAEDHETEAGIMRGAAS